MEVLGYNHDGPEYLNVQIEPGQGWPGESWLYFIESVYFRYDEEPDPEEWELGPRWFWIDIASVHDIHDHLNNLRWFREQALACEESGETPIERLARLAFASPHEVSYIHLWMAFAQIGHRSRQVGRSRLAFVDSHDDWEFLHIVDYDACDVVSFTLSPDGSWVY